MILVWWSNTTGWQLTHVYHLHRLLRHCPWARMGIWFNGWMLWLVHCESPPVIWQSCWVRYLFLTSYGLVRSSACESVPSLQARGTPVTHYSYTSPAEIWLLLTRRERWIFINRKMILTLFRYPMVGTSIFLPWWSKFMLAMWSEGLGIDTCQQWGSNLQFRDCKFVFFKNWAILEKQVSITWQLHPRIEDNIQEKEFTAKVCSINPWPRPYVAGSVVRNQTRPGLMWQLSTLIRSDDAIPMHYASTASLFHLWSAWYN